MFCFLVFVMIVVLMLFVFVVVIVYFVLDGFVDLVECLFLVVVNIFVVQCLDIDDCLLDFLEGFLFECFNDIFGDGLCIVNLLGFGFIIDFEGIVVINNYVIDGVDEVEVFLLDGWVFLVQVIGIDLVIDLVVLCMEIDESMFYVVFGDSDWVCVGDWVIVIGNFYGLGGLFVVGVVLVCGWDVGGCYDDYIQIDVVINIGNFGGLLFNMVGDVVGVNMMILLLIGVSVGILLFILFNIVMCVVDQLVEFGEICCGWLGVFVQLVMLDMVESYDLEILYGVIICNVEDNGFVDEGGLC